MSTGGGDKISNHMLRKAPTFPIDDKDQWKKDRWDRTGSSDSDSDSDYPIYDEDLPVYDEKNNHEFPSVEESIMSTQLWFMKNDPEWRPGNEYIVVDDPPEEKEECCKKSDCQDCTAFEIETKARRKRNFEEHLEIAGKMNFPTVGPPYPKHAVASKKSSQEVDISKEGKPIGFRKINF